MRVHVDTATCRGHARCIALVPEAFDFDDETNVSTAKPDKEITDVPTERLREAARACPELAITVTDEEDV